MFSYDDDIVFAFSCIKKEIVDTFISRWKFILKCRDLDKIKFFFDVQIFKIVDFIYWMQDVYINNLVKEYKIKKKIQIVSLSQLVTRNVVTVNYVHVWDR
jgi:hypothetical protein